MTVAFTFLCRRRKWALAIGPVTGLAVAVVGQIALADGGPGAFAGLVMFPLYGLLLSWLTLRLVGAR